MKIKQWHVSNPEQIHAAIQEMSAEKPDLALCFGSTEYFGSEGLPLAFKTHMPKTSVAGCTTSGEIDKTGVHDHQLVLASLKLEKSKAHVASVPFGSNEKEAGRLLGQQLNEKGSDLKAILLFAPGLNIKGTALIESLRASVGPQPMISGGLAGDNAEFKQTLALANGQILANGLVAVGLYGKSLFVKTGSWGGWRPFGPVRKVTKASGNLVQELDGKPAMELYSNYISQHAKDKQGMNLLFPFAVLDEKEDETGLIRAIQVADAKSGTLTLAGDIEEGAMVRLMHANNQELVRGAGEAAKMANDPRFAQNSLALLISCVARRFVMNDDIDSEVEAVHDVLGKMPGFLGFYSYGEICPYKGFKDTKLHNQTMTITCITEAA